MMSGIDKLKVVDELKARKAATAYFIAETTGLDSNKIGCFLRAHEGFLPRSSEKWFVKKAGRERRKHSHPGNYVTIWEYVPVKGRR